MSTETDSPAPASRLASAVAVVGLIIALAAAVSVDLVRTGFSIKGDEATYVTMALSVAYDHDLSYEHGDLERFWELYRRGPEGIFLKRGKQLGLDLGSSPPYVHEVKWPDQRTDRLYFGKSFIYPLAVAPFVRVMGMNGFLVFNVLLLFGVCVCGFQFLRARSRPGPALVFTLAFVGATVVPVYAVFLTPEIFNFALAFFAFFLWLYKEVARPDGARSLRGFGSDVWAAVLLAVITYSKPTNVLLIAPMIGVFWWRRRFWRGTIVGAVFVATTLGLFSVNAMNSGEFNYQGGDRKTFYGGFPFDGPDATWDRRGISMTTNDSDAEHVLNPSEFLNRFSHNLEYFLIGRHFGFVPYFFPGFVALGLWGVSRDRFQVWRVLTFASLAASSVILLVFFPYSWSGGGGPTGNRYFLSLYPALFFLTPPLESIAPGTFAWIGGALFTAKMLVNPFVAAKFPYEATEHGLARRLPVELTMATDLPVMLDGDSRRTRLPYGQNPTVFLYLIDQNAYPPEPAGVWVSGAGRADILIRSDQPIHHLSMTVQSPIRTVFTASIGGSDTSVPLTPGKAVTFDMRAYGVRGLNSYAYLLSAESSEAFVPHLQDPKSSDPRNLGALMEFRVVSAPAR